MDLQKERSSKEFYKFVILNRSKKQTKNQHIKKTTLSEGEWRPTKSKELKFGDSFDPKGIWKRNQKTG